MIQNPDDFIITRKRKKYKFALFANSPIAHELDEWKGRFAPTILEVGAGTGLFGVGLAERMPGSNILAVDVKADRLQTGARLAEAKGLVNIQFLRARVDQLVEVIEPHSLDVIWVTFPDPFPKDRMSKHRLTHTHFLTLYAQLLKPGGAICFKTDAVNLFTWSLERLVENKWIINELSFDLHESNLSDDYKIMTTYEMRYRREGKPIHFVKTMPSQG